jgi:hypothetical protein
MKGYLLSLFLYCITAGAQPNADMDNLNPSALSVIKKTYFFSLGERKLPIHVQQYGDVKDLVFINMHDDEFTSVEATRQLLESRGGFLIQIENSQKRNIKFRMRGVTYQFDPNRIFSREGIKSSLEFFHRRKVNERVISEVENFGQWLLRLIPENPKCVIALHNNTNENFTIKDYLPGQSREDAAENVYVEPGQDGDDLFLTTEAFIYSAIKEAGYNIILQANSTAKDDGSLSIYCGRNNIRYVNLETEHGKLQQYREMMTTLLDILNGAKPGRVFYNFSLQLTDTLSGDNIKSGTKIYFNEKEVGELSTIEFWTETQKITGQFSIKKDFTVYSNSDFFIFQQSSSAPVIEIRIDPTREKSPTNPQKDIIVIQLK